jgi:hypothetical protein
LAYWHHPRFSSGPHGGEPDVRAFWQALYEADAEVVLSAHDHIYERFAPQDPEGRLDECAWLMTQKPWLSICRGTLNLLRKLTKEPYMLEMSKKIQNPNGMGLALTFPSPTYVASIASMTKGPCPDPASCSPRSHDAAAR